MYKRQALAQAKEGRAHILQEMNKTIKSSRKEVSKHTPKIETVMVDKKDIAAVIGKGGATIREIVEKSGALLLKAGRLNYSRSFYFINSVR